MKPRTKTTVLALLAAPLLASGLSACNAEVSASASTHTISGTKLASSVEKQLVDSNPGLTVAHTACDDTPVIGLGRTTSCTATVDDKNTTLIVTWKNEKGDYVVNSVA